MTQIGTPLTGTPSVSAVRSSLKRDIRWAAMPPLLFLPNAANVDASEARDSLNSDNVAILRNGLEMGKITASGLWAPSFIGTIDTAHTSDVSTTLSSSVATATELNRRVGASGTFNMTGPPTAGGTVATLQFTYSAINLTTGDITITAEITNFVTGSWIQPEDGSETVKALLFTNDDDGERVVDPIDLTEVDTDINLVIGGMILSVQMPFWPADAAMRTYLKDALKLNGMFVFDTDF